MNGDCSVNVQNSLIPKDTAATIPHAAQNTLGSFPAPSNGLARHCPNLERGCGSPPQCQGEQCDRRYASKKRDQLRQMGRTRNLVELAVGARIGIVRGGKIKSVVPVRKPPAADVADFFVQRMRRAEVSAVLLHMNCRNVRLRARHRQGLQRPVRGTHTVGKGRTSVMRDAAGIKRDIRGDADERKVNRGDRQKTALQKESTLIHDEYCASLFTPVPQASYGSYTIINRMPLSAPQRSLDAATWLG